MAKKNSGDWAESKFQLMCDGKVASRNKALHDRTGWDFLVEFDPGGGSNVPLDRRLGGATARVQVKSQTSGKPRCTLKLDNALRFCREPNPCFVFHVHAPDTPRTRYFIREFDQELMALCLRRAREADRDGKAPHKVYVPIDFGSEHELPENKVIEWIRSRTLVDAVAYAANKAKLNKTLGVDSSAVRGSFTFASSKTQQLIEHGVGMTEVFDVDEVRLEDIRFDIPAQQPLISGKPTQFSMQVHPRKARVTIVGENGRVAKFDGEWRAMNLPGLGDDSFRATFKSRYLNGTMYGPGPLTFSFQFKASERCPLSDICNQSALVAAARTLVSPIVWIEGIGDMPMCDVSLEVASDWPDWVDQSLSLMAKVARPADKPNLSLNDLGAKQALLERFRYAVGEGAFKLDIELEDDPESRLIATNILYYAYFEVGDSTFATIVKRPCTGQSGTGKQLVLDFGKPDLLERTARRGPWAKHERKVIKHFRTWEERLGLGVVMLGDGDFMKMTGGPVSIRT